LHVADPMPVAAWRADLRHTAARERGRADWDEAVAVRVARGERTYDFRRAGRAVGATA
jgi:hypothetical protein